MTDETPTGRAIRLIREEQIEACANYLERHGKPELAEAMRKSMLQRTKD